jgi:hypothetical protein
MQSALIEKINTIPYLMDYFKQYPEKSVFFIQQIESSKQMDKRHLLSLLIGIYIGNCGFSLGYRTFAYDPTIIDYVNLLYFK